MVFEKIARYFVLRGFDVFSEIDKNREKFIQRLRESVEIPSVSAEAAYREDVFRMIDWAQKVGAAVKYHLKNISSWKNSALNASKSRTG